MKNGVTRKYSINVWTLEWGLYEFLTDSAVSAVKVIGSSD